MYFDVLLTEHSEIKHPKLYLAWKGSYWHRAYVLCKYCPTLHQNTRNVPKYTLVRSKL